MSNCKCRIPNDHDPTLLDPDFSTCDFCGIDHGFPYVPDLHYFKAKIVKAIWDSFGPNGPCKETDECMYRRMVSFAIRGEYQHRIHYSHDKKWLSKYFDKKKFILWQIGRKIKTWSITHSM